MGSLQTNAICRDDTRLHGSSVPGGEGLFLRRRHRDPGNLHVDRAEVVTAGEVQRLPVVAAEGDVRGGGSAVDDAAELLPPRIHDPDPAGAAAIDIALHVDLHAVGNPGLAAAQVGEDAVGVLGQGAAGQKVEGANVRAARVVDVEHGLIGGEGEAVGQHEVRGEQAQGAQIGRDAVDTGEGQVPLLGGGRAGPGVGEVDAAIRLHHHVVGAVESAALEAVG